MKLVFAMAWRNLLRQRWRTALTALMMGMAVALCMVMLAFVDGVHGQLRDVLILGSLGHVQVTDPDWPGRRTLSETIDRAESRIAAIEGAPGVEGVAARVYGPALAGGADRTGGVQVIGLMPEREVTFRKFEKQLVAGRWLDGTPGDAVIGVDLAKTLAVGVGDSVVTMTQSADGSLGNALYTVVGTLRTGGAIDKSGLLVSLADAQALLALEGRVHEITVIGESDDEAVVAGLATAVGAALASPDLLVRTWYQVDPGTADLFRIQAISLVIFVALFMAVAATGVVNTLLMSVYERTRELGVLRALGVRPRMLVALIFTESVLIGVLGVIGGVVAGLGMDAYTVLHGVDLSVKGGGMSAANVQLDPILYARLTVRSVLLPVVEVMLFSMIAAIWPAWRVARLQPIDAIRDL